jgi:hypothetical protein
MPVNKNRKLTMAEKVEETSKRTDRQSTYSVTTRRVRVGIFAAEKQ